MTQLAKPGFRMDAWSVRTFHSQPLAVPGHPAAVGYPGTSGRRGFSVLSARGKQAIQIIQPEKNGNGYSPDSRN